MKVRSTKTRNYTIDVHPYVRDLRKYLDPSIYSSLLDPGIFEFQRKEMTIVFWDISGFSNFCNEVATVEQIIPGFLKDYFSEAMNIIHKNKGVVHKFLGDGIMAHFGSEVNAIMAAIRVRKSFGKITEKWLHVCKILNIGKKISLSIKCGIHSGKVLFGLLDTGDRYEITSVGPIVNLASRLEDRAGINQIIVSKEIRDKIKLRFKMKRINIPTNDRIKSYGHIKAIYDVAGSL